MVRPLIGKMRTAGFELVQVQIFEVLDGEPVRRYIYLVLFLASPGSLLLIEEGDRNDRKVGKGKRNHDSFG